MANQININIYNDDYVIDIHNHITIRDFESEIKVYPLVSSKKAITKLKLRRTYKALCSICECITNTYNPDRVAMCYNCEKKVKAYYESSKLRVVCYSCNRVTSSFEKDKCGFLCTSCVEAKNEVSYCPICEYEISIKRTPTEPCDLCKDGHIRRPHFSKEKKVLCCNCEQVAIQLNPNNPNVYCYECKFELFSNPC